VRQGATYLAFDATAVTAARLRRGVRGGRLAAFARTSLAEGALVPSGSSPNLGRPEEVREAVRSAIAGLGGTVTAVTLVLPDGVARLALLDPPPGTAIAEYARFRLVPPLPWAAAEAIVELLPAGSGRHVGAAVRRAVVSEYEQAVAAVGLLVERVHLAPLVVLSALLARGGESGIHAILGDSALCLAVLRKGTLAALRHRRRARRAGEGEWVLAEAARAAGNGPAEGLPLRLTGSGADALRREAGRGEGGLEAPSGWSDAAEAAWLCGLVS
jgi:hypothetical protein